MQVAKLDTTEDAEEDEEDEMDTSTGVLECSFMLIKIKVNFL